MQDFIPAPFDVAACMFHTGLDPFTKKPVFVAKHLRDRKLQRALMQFFKPENYFMVRKILLDAGRKDLIGDGCDALIPTHPPREALEARQRQAQRLASDGDSSTNSPDEDHYHSRSRTPRPRLPPETTDGPTQVVFVGRAPGKLANLQLDRGRLACFHYPP